MENLIEIKNAQLVFDHAVIAEYSEVGARSIRILIDFKVDGRGLIYYLVCDCPRYVDVRRGAPSEKNKKEDFKMKLEKFSVTKRKNGEIICRLEYDSIFFFVAVAGFLGRSMANLDNTTKKQAVEALICGLDYKGESK